MGSTTASTTAQTTSGATLTLNAVRFQPGMPLKAVVTFSGGHASTTQKVIFSIVHADGTVATSAAQAVSGTVERHLFAPGSLSAGPYTLRAQVVSTTGSSAELTAPFTVVTTGSYAVHGSWLGVLLLFMLGGAWLWYQRMHAGSTR